MNDFERSKAIDVLPRMEIAIENLITGEGDARNRLYWAIPNITPLSELDFPVTLRKRYIKLMAEFRNIKQFKLNDIDHYLIKTEGSFSVYLKKIKNKTAKRHIQELHSIYKELHILIKS